MLVWYSTSLPRLPWGARGNRGGSGTQWSAPWHQAYLRWYDREGPKVAAVIQDKPILKALVRAFFTPSARLARWWLEKRQEKRRPELQ